MFRRHRAAAPPVAQEEEEEEADEEDDDDVFSSLARARRKKKVESKSSKSKEENPVAAGDTQQPLTAAQQPLAAPPPSTPLVASTTSSMKRHHKETNHARKAKMDALLHELQWEQQHEPQPAPHHHQKKRSSKKSKGSYVEPGQEHVTTNLFVGNLAPHLTEEDLTQVFGQFGALHSVKIMWPRTAQERTRNRLTGFVCYSHREDAEEALRSLSETDPFCNGRRIRLQWGKSVLDGGESSSSSLSARGSSSSRSTPCTQPAAPPMSHSQARICVVLPRDPVRRHFISLVASFVAKDGADLEHRLLQQQRPDIAFLSYDEHKGGEEEQLFYKWRVYAYAQGDGEFVWRTEPFVMVPHGHVWIPPPLLPEAAQRQEELQRRQQEEHQKQQSSLKRYRGKPSKPSQSLSPAELDEFHILTRQELCASREAIARAMAFCFEKSHAAREIANLLKELLLQRTQVSLETRIARLYLLSDVLFNSQQPGVRNAFHYRDAIEQMAPSVFCSLGQYSREEGRMSQHKMNKAVSSVLAAWTNWSVYIPSFLDELQDRYEGREPVESPPSKNVKDDNVPHDPMPTEEQREKDAAIAQERNDSHAIAPPLPRGSWKEVEDMDDNEIALDDDEEDGTTSPKQQTNSPVAPLEDADGEPLDDADGEPIDDTDNGEPLDDPDLGDADGEPLEDTDGEPLDDPDGEPLDDPDGEPLDDPDGEPLDDPDGEQLKD